jgi:putative Holliday junction resolvase
MKRGRRIAFDFGDSRIGVAVCDPDGILATPLPYLDAKHPKLSSSIKAIFEEYEPIAIFVGEPKLLSGDAGSAVEKVAAFKELLVTLTSVPVVLIDERLTSVESARKLREAGKSARNSRELIDSMSAVAILETGLQHGH